jgi:hypothetical protein
MAPLNRLGIAMNAIQIAGPGHVPDHDRFLINGELKEVGGEVS